MTNPHVTNATIYGQEVDWSETDEGHLTVYEMAPNLIPVDQVARVIYELRLDVTRLNAEAIGYFKRLQKIRTFANERTTDSTEPLPVDLCPVCGRRTTGLFQGLPVCDNCGWAAEDSEFAEYTDEDARRGDR